MSDLDDEELEATRRLNGVAKMSDIEKDIKRCEQLIKPEHANWIGISNQLAIAHVVDRVKELEEENKRKDMFVEMAKEVIENSIPKQEVKDLIKNETINISGFECIALKDVEELLEGE